jgi:hypothetical protein
VGQRHARGRRRPLRRGDAGDIAHRYSGKTAGLGLFGPAPEDHRIAALQACDDQPLTRQVHQQSIDRLLRDLVEFRQLADIDPPHALGHQRHDLGADQPVMHHHIRRLDQSQGLQGQQFGIAGTGTDQVDMSEQGTVVFHGENPGRKRKGRE